MTESEGDITSASTVPAGLSEFENEEGMQSELEALRRRLQDLERQNNALLSVISACPRCSKELNFDRSNGCTSDTWVDHAKSSDLLPLESTLEHGHGPGGENIESMKGCEKRVMHQYRKRHVALKIMYYGQRYFGFASEAHMDPTVESEILKALSKTKLAIGSKEDINYSRCGRTDKGVSSSGQVIALHVRSALKNGEANADVQEEIDYVKVLNRVLPKDIRVMGWCPVPNIFHSRFSCLSREYKYFFWRDKMDIVAMQDAGKRFIGEHDFRNFCKMDALNVSNYTRQITAFEICSCNERYYHDELYAFVIRGSAFLWHQVRCMIAVLFMVGQGLESPMIIDLLLDISKTPRKPQYNMASESSLLLRSCQFDDLKFCCSPDARQALVDAFTRSIQTYELQAAIFREALSCFSLSGETNSDYKCKKKKNTHIPLLRRPTEPSYEERQAKLSLKINKTK